MNHESLGMHLPMISSRDANPIVDDRFIPKSFLGAAPTHHAGGAKPLPDTHQNPSWRHLPPTRPSHGFGVTLTFSGINFRPMSKGHNPAWPVTPQNGNSSVGSPAESLRFILPLSPSYELFACFHTNYHLQHCVGKRFLGIRLQFCPVSPLHPIEYIRLHKRLSYTRTRQSRMSANSPRLEQRQSFPIILPFSTHGPFQPGKFRLLSTPSIQIHRSLASPPHRTLTVDAPPRSAGTTSTSITNPPQPSVLLAHHGGLEPGERWHDQLAHRLQQRDVYGHCGVYGHRLVQYH